jgi:hypothetical protein
MRSGLQFEYCMGPKKTVFRHFAKLRHIKGFITTVAGVYIRLIRQYCTYLVRQFMYAGEIREKSGRYYYSVYCFAAVLRGVKYT